MTDIFISYAREDEARIRPLVEAFEEQGWDVFWDRRTPAGQTWRNYIGQALEDARCVIVAWSQHSIISKWVIAEADKSSERDILVPVFLDSVEPPMPFGTLQTADLTTWQPGESSPHFEQLVQDISAVLTGTPRSPVPPITPGPDKTKPAPDGVFKDLKVRLALVFVIGVIAAILGWYLYISGDPFLKYYYIAVVLFCPALWLIMKYCSEEMQKKAVIYLFLFAAFFVILAVGWRYFEVSNYLDRQIKSPATKLDPPTGFEHIEAAEGLKPSYTSNYVPYFLLLGTCLFVTFVTIFYYTADEKSSENRIPIIGWFLGLSIVIGLSRLAWQIIDSLLLR
jgi:hypothetical protein